MLNDIRRAKELKAKGIRYVDVGTSGGVWGFERGYCLMIGGEGDAALHLDPIFKALASGRGDSRGSLVASWLLDLTAIALFGQPDLSEFSGRASDSGEDRGTITAAVDEGAPVPVLSAALYQRFASRGEEDF